MIFRGRKHRGGDLFSQVQDPGKDLFAYLFLVMLIFSFIILLTYEQKVRREAVQQSPTEISQGSSSLITLNTGQIGRLVKREEKVCLLFGEKTYFPDTDIAVMEKDGIIKQVSRNGRKAKVLYLKEDPRSSIYLKEYLETFSALSQHGIDIAFARQMK